MIDTPIPAQSPEVEGETKETRAFEILPDVPLEPLLEALLLTGGEPIPLDRLIACVRKPKQEVEASLERLTERYNQAMSGFELSIVGGKYQLRTKTTFGAYIRDFMAIKPRRLSQAALETLAVIAYQQPIVKSEIEKIRGVDVSPTIKTLLERQLVKVLGHQPTVGQPALYGTTEEFLRIFGLESLKNLPTLRELQVLLKEPGEAQDSDAQNSAAQNSEGQQSEIVPESDAVSELEQVAA